MPTAFGHPSAPGEPARVTAFRATHRVGQRVRGRILEELTPGLAWIDIAGSRLTAHIAPPVVPGRTALLRIESLTPDIVLRELHPGDAIQSDEDSLQGLSLDAAETVLRLRTMRDRLEALPAWPQAVTQAAHAHLDACAAAKAFAAHLANADGADLRLRLDSLLRHWNTLAIRHGLPFRADYRPWLLPNDSSAELLVAPGNTGALRAELTCASPSSSTLRGVSLLLDSRRQTCRIELSGTWARPPDAAELRHLLTGLLLPDTEPPASIDIAHRRGTIPQGAWALLLHHAGATLRSTLGVA